MNCNVQACCRYWWRVIFYSILLHWLRSSTFAAPPQNSFVLAPILCLHMSGIQVLLCWLWEQGDKWRCAALYFHVRMLFFHLIGLLSHSMWRRRGNRKWRRRMGKRWSTDVGWGEGWGLTTDDLSWSIPGETIAWLKSSSPPPPPPFTHSMFNTLTVLIQAQW